MRTIHEETYYTSMEHMIKVYEDKKRKSGFSAKTKDEFEKWKVATRSVLSEITGISKMEPCEPVVKFIETCKLNGYRRDKLLLQTEPGVWMPFYALVPDGLEKCEKRPSMIATHGHGSCGKYSPAGRADIPAVLDAIKIYNYDYGVKFVKKGYIVFCPDARGFGERREFMDQGDQEDKFMGNSCIPLNHQAMSLGMTQTGMWTWDLMRLIDYIETREDCDAKRIGCGGLSGGGLQTLWLAAMDDRIACAVVSGYFYGYRDSLLKLPHNCGCNYVPHLWEHVDMGDLGALIAPRPLLIESGSKDPLNGERGLVNVTEQVEITTKAYHLLNAQEKLYHYVFEGVHAWNGEKTYSFVDKWLKGSNN